MVCIRCKIVVTDELDKLDFKFSNLEIGEVDIIDNINQEQIEIFDQCLRKYGLELITDKRAKHIEKIKNIIIDLIHYTEEDIDVNYSEFLTEKLHYDYTYLANLFSEVTGTTIQQFIIKHKIERVKELIVYDELNLSQIAWKLHYTSVQHLSNQFKKVTGLTPSHFKKLKVKRLSTIS